MVLLLDGYSMLRAWEKNSRKMYKVSPFFPPPPSPLPKTPGTHRKLSSYLLIGEMNVRGGGRLYAHIRMFALDFNMNGAKVYRKL